MELLPAISQSKKTPSVIWDQLEPEHGFVDREGDADVDNAWTPSSKISDKTG